MICNSCLGLGFIINTSFLECFQSYAPLVVVVFAIPRADLADESPHALLLVFLRRQEHQIECLLRNVTLVD